MTQDEIIRMARKARLFTIPKSNGIERFPLGMERFAHLIAAHEREECAEAVDHILKEGGGTYGDLIRARGK